MDTAKTAERYAYSTSSCRYRTPQTKSKVVVGAKSNPAMTPQRYDCGLENTTLYGFRMLAEVEAAASVRCSFGVIHTNKNATTNTRSPDTYQNVGTVITPLTKGLTAICPIDPPSIPTH